MAAPLHPYPKQIACMLRWVSSKFRYPKKKHLVVMSADPSKMEIVFLNCSFITPTTTASSSTAVSQESHPCSTYQVQCFTAACKLILHPNSNSNWRHLWPLVALRVEYHRGLTKVSIASVTVPTVPHTHCNLFPCKNMVYGSVTLPRPCHNPPPCSSLAAVRASGSARIKQANISESSLTAIPSL